MSLICDIPDVVEFLPLPPPLNLEQHNIAPSTPEQQAQALKFVRDMAVSDGKSSGAFWATKSAMHKEIRRNDWTRALSYGRWFHHMANNSSVKKYIYSCATEETRNLDMLLWMAENHASRKGAATWVDFLHKITSSIKKWEVPCLAHTESILFEVSARARLVLTEDEVTERTLSVDSLTEAYHIFISISMPEQDERKQQLMGEALLERLPKDVSDPLKLYFKHRHISFNPLQTMIDYLFIPECIEAASTYPHAQEPADLTYDFYPYEPYVMDNHVRPGNQALKQGRDAWFRNEQPPGTDLRWSGAEIGNLWRYLAFHSGDPDWMNQSWMQPFEACDDDLRTYHRALAVQAHDSAFMPRFKVMAEHIDLGSLVGFDWTVLR